MHSVHDLLQRGLGLVGIGSPDSDPILVPRITRDKVYAASGAAAAGCDLSTSGQFWRTRFFGLGECRNSLIAITLKLS